MILTGRPPPAPAPAAAVAGFYDALAPDYDTAYGGRREAMENLALRVLLQASGVLRPRRDGLVLDLGAGTGLLLDLAPALPASRYLGVDLSAGMLAVARAKHPRHRFHRGDMLAPPLAGRVAGAAVSLWCAANYAHPTSFAAALAATLRPGGRLFVMATAGRYRPVQHTPAMDALLFDWPPAEALAALRHAGFRGVRARPFTWPWEGRGWPLAALALAQVWRTLAGPGAAATPAGSGHRYTIFTGKAP